MKNDLFQAVQTVNSLKEVYVLLHTKHLVHEFRLVLIKHACTMWNITLYNKNERIMTHSEWHMAGVQLHPKINFSRVSRICARTLEYPARSSWLSYIRKKFEYVLLLSLINYNRMGRNNNATYDIICLNKSVPSEIFCIKCSQLYAEVVYKSGDSLAIFFRESLLCKK